MREVEQASNFLVSLVTADTPSELMDKEIWANYHQLIACLETRVTIKAKVVTGYGGSPHDYNDTQMIEVARQPPYTLAMVRKSVKSGYIN